MKPGLAKGVIIGLLIEAIVFIIAMGIYWFLAKQMF